jgi:hypothetical protein
MDLCVGAIRIFSSEVGAKQIDRSACHGGGDGKLLLGYHLKANE